jgi:hypothetical protein
VQTTEGNWFTGLIDWIGCFKLGIPLLTGGVAWVVVALGDQRRYLRLAHQGLGRLAGYLQSRAVAIRNMESADVSSLEQLETRIAEKLKLDIRPSSLTWRAYFPPAERSYLRTASLQLATDTYCQFADDLIERLCLLLDGYVDLANQRKATWSSTYVADRTKLRESVRHDLQQLELQIQVMQQYIAGSVEVDIYSVVTARAARDMLDGKYRSYLELLADDTRAST